VADGAFDRKAMTSNVTPTATAATATPLETHARGLGAKVVVPGHGKSSGPDLFDLTISGVRDARAAAHR
jgi:hypothetical protein